MNMRARVGALAFLLALPLAALGMDLDRQVAFHIPAQDLSSALIEFSRQSRLQVIVADDLTGQTTRGVNGQKAIKQALRQLLEPAGLDYRVAGETSITVGKTIKTTDAETPAVRAGSGNSPIRVAQASRTDTAPDPQGLDGPGPAATESSIPVPQIVVTGTNIRGIESPGAAVHRFERAAIEQSGIGTTEQFLQSLPQNFGGGNSASTVGGILGGEESNFNYGHGTGVNLRGLGNDSTLVLVNGRRVAPAGVGNFVDISMIPLTAVERMELLPDGASAIYGSDAVAGVVNITLRRDFDGAESSARYASVTSGNSDELRLGQVLGTRWDGGSAMLAYEYFDRSPLDSQDRAFTRDYTDTTWLMPTEKRHGVISSLEQRFGERVNAFANASYSKRDSEVLYNGGFVETDTRAKVEQHGVTAGASVDMSAGWRAEIAGAYSANNTFYRVSFPGFQNALDQNSDVYSVDVKADGDLFAATGGQAKLAFGGQYRREKFDARNNAFFELDRDARAVFAELFWPLIGPGNSAPLARRLELSLAGRFEDYSDFGSTFDPRLGLVWAPAEGLSLRGTIGTSFRSPLLSELRPQLFVDVFNFFDPLAGAAVPVLFLQGGTGQLGPEQSTAWTVGLDVEPAAVPGMKLSLTYFDVDFEDRITIPIPFSALGSVLSEEERYAIAIERDPDLARVNQLFAEPTFFNPDGVLPGDIVAIIDDRIRNVARRTQQGLDFTLGYATALASGQLGAQLSGTYLFSMDEQVTPASPAVALVNHAFYPTDLKLRGNVSWSGRAWGASAFLNYIDDYRDTRTTTPQTVSSWTTVDVSLRYEGFTSTRLSLNVLNAFDRAPPFVAGNGLNFDATNASALGRFASVQITYQW